MGGVLWTPEAVDLEALGDSGVMEGGQPRCTWHVTVSPSGRRAGYSDPNYWFNVMHRVLRSKEAEPHYLWDPVTDHLGQYFPLNRSARALRNDGTRRTNGTGICNIQIEVVAMADDFTRYWEPGPNFAAMLRDIRSWGVPDVWPGGDPFGQPARSWSTYVKAGHFGHVHVPGNDHTDPQVRDGALLLLEEDDMNEDDARVLLTGSAIMKNALATDPDKAPRVAASYLLEQTAAMAKVHGVQLGAVGKALAELKAQVGAIQPVAAAPITDEQLERVLRKVVGSVDNT